jgi:predicted RNase H-like nuclease/ppGpp synthetase/RelA/SpoT-type nucleotidyltranferase
MHFVGLDLAWGERNPTGVAVLDARGALQHLSAQTDDASVLQAVGRYAEGPVLVAVDAPLVVTNPTGNRPCEAALNRVFARFDAGAHPANTGKPEFAQGPRGARLARALGLDIDPASTAPRRALEVYPHPATVALFRLGRTLKYKQKPGRPLLQLREELLRLMTLLEGLREATPPLRVERHEGWQALRRQVVAATRKSELRRVEDQVDAVVCAYVGMFAERRPEDVTVYGDVDQGYIVTPTLPPGLLPTPRVANADAPAPAAAPARAVETYASLQPRLQRWTDSVVRLVTGLLDDAGINYLSVTGRAKSVASFAAKTERATPDGPLYPRPLEDITDQVGVRVITYLQGDVTAVADVLTDQLTILDDRDMGRETASQGRFGYASRHLLVQPGPVTVAGPSYDEEVGRPVQVQIRTVLQHAWAEFEHATRYKGTIPAEYGPELDRRFTLAAGLLELADREFTLIRDQLQATEVGLPVAVDDTDPRLGSQELAAFLAGTYADAEWSRADHYAWMSGLLLELGVTSLDELSGVLATVDQASIMASMGYRHPPRAVRRLDDALLARFGERYVGLHGNEHRSALLATRLEKLGDAATA